MIPIKNSVGRIADWEHIGDGVYYVVFSDGEELWTCEFPPELFGA